MINKEEEFKYAFEAINTSNNHEKIRLVYQDSHCPKCRLWLANDFTLQRHNNKENNCKNQNKKDRIMGNEHYGEAGWWYYD
jgi:hypothetical protein